ARERTGAIASAVEHGSGDIAVDVDEQQQCASNAIPASPLPGGEIGGGAGVAGARKLLESIGGELLAGAGPGDGPSGGPSSTATWRAAIILPERSQRE